MTAAGFARCITSHRPGSDDKRSLYCFPGALDFVLVPFIGRRYQHFWRLCFLPFFLFWPLSPFLAKFVSLCFDDTILRFLIRQSASAFYFLCQSHSTVLPTVLVGSEESGCTYRTTTTLHPINTLVILFLIAPYFPRIL